MIIAFLFSSSLHSIQSIQSDLIIALIQQQQFLIYENHVETAVVVFFFEAVSITYMSGKFIEVIREAIENKLQ